MKYRILIPCSGLGVINRGYESALPQCAEILRESGLFDILVLGGGPAPAVDAVIPSLRRNWFSCAGTLVSPARAYKLEQASFFFMGIQKALRFDPHVVYLSDQLLAHFFYKKRLRSGAKYRILFRNGAPHKPPYSFCDHVQQIHPSHYHEARALGEASENMTLLVSGFNFERAVLPLQSPELQSLKCSLGLPPDRPILLAVGAIGANYKRIDYILDEVAKLQPRPFLVCLGALDRGAGQIRAQASRLLGDDVLLRTVASEEVPQYLRVADLFIHAALSEGLGRSILEAAAAAKPCLLHDGEGYRAILADYPYYADFNQTGALAALIKHCLAAPVDNNRLDRQRQFVYEHYSWQSLRDNFIELIQSQAELALK